MKYLKKVSIRSKIFVCFLVPTVFIIIVGYTAYHKAAQGMTEKYQESTMQTLCKTTEYIELGNSLIESKALEYAYDKELNKYASGLYDEDAPETGALMTMIREDMGAVCKSNPFVSDIYIVTKEDVTMATTKKSNVSMGVYDKYMENTPMDGKIPQKWIDSHEVLDAHLEVVDWEYIIAYQQLSQNKTFCVVVDVKEQAIEEQIKSLNLGEGSIVAFVTQNGREIIARNMAEGEEEQPLAEETVFWGQEFFTDAMLVEELVGARNVTYQGKEHLFIFSKSEKNFSTICALIPMETVVGQAEHIKTITVALVLLAGMISSAIGVMIASGIQKNMNRISGCLSQVAQGNLTASVEAKGRDEFRDLATVTSDMISRNKKLVQKVGGATTALERSAGDVNVTSRTIKDYSMEMEEAVISINDSMERQSKHARECVNRTDSLSEEIKGIGSIMREVEGLVGNTEEMIRDGVNAVTVLGERAEETTEITTQVEGSIAALQEETEIINDFVKLINDISEQTNLLSLNASIEAARVGEAGKGFAVVAEEIRTLADNSANAAKEIQKKVSSILEQSLNSAQQAHKAQKMVSDQKKSVDDTVQILTSMNEQIALLISKLKQIANRTEQAERERGETMEAVKSISMLIEDTANSAEVVERVIARLSDSVNQLNGVSDTLERNMEDLKGEISAFRTE